jgi:hypothetical protein
MLIHGAGSRERNLSRRVNLTVGRYSAQWRLGKPKVRMVSRGLT